MHQLTHRPLRLAAAVTILTAALVAALLALPRDHATATPPSGIAAELLARGTIAHAGHVRVAGSKLATRGPIDVATVHVTFQSGGSTGWHTHPGPSDVNLTRNQTSGVTETVVTFLLPVGAPITVDAPAPRHCPL
jgi:hypothetical protein